MDGCLLNTASLQVTLDGISQFYVDCGGSRAGKFHVLCDLYSSIAVAQSIIFVNTRRDAERLGYEMDRADFTVSVIHGDMTMEQREATFNVFLQGGSRVLVATDILARGIDVQQVWHHKLLARYRETRAHAQANAYTEAYVT